MIDNNLGEVFDAPYDVYLDEENVVPPDILLVSRDRLSIIGEKNIQGSPDMVIKIVSENSAYRDIVQKKNLYARFGVKEYWIVIPET
ncbi:Uma2 family endonuclease [Candidatus Kuenenia stuttgartiensis]|uniref:Uma2 family endonuclease n=1 Tax=Kuenenia stuttgartiensis TaxID=174633 RepID=UPI0013EADA37|nr:Uma2 family endonuclease [Candidatus Kuenenia stuttgartiensis]MCF6153196.1 Uma2 family endonuclease [Candidatus Kuenenia stuttgartiensis]